MKEQEECCIPDGLLWAPDHLSPDYRHLDTALEKGGFVFNSKSLKNMCARNFFDLSGAGDSVVFGLRGCGLLSEAGCFSSFIELAEDVPDHIHNRCVIGVWKRSDGMLAGFGGSTVPNWQEMQKQLENPGKNIANLLPTGFYRYRVGVHGSDIGDMPGTLIQDVEAVALRAKNEPAYTVGDQWCKKRYVGDNIHAGRYGLKTAEFSSAGCQTIPGDYENGRPIENCQWFLFRRALGLNNETPRADNGKIFHYVLLTGREARLFSMGGDKKTLARLRFGSTGRIVKAFQESLKMEEKDSDGVMEGNTVWAFIERQKETGFEFRGSEKGFADGIVTPETAGMFGIDLC